VRWYSDGAHKRGMQFPAAAEPGSPDLRGRGPGPRFRARRIGRCLSQPTRARHDAKKSATSATAAPDRFTPERLLNIGSARWRLVVRGLARVRVSDVGRSGHSTRQGAAKGYVPAKARRANGYVNRLPLRSAHARLVEDATRPQSGHASVTDCGIGALRPKDVVATRGLGRRVRGRLAVMRDETGWFTPVGAGYPECGTTGVCSVGVGPDRDSNPQR
jgi:hypothetical protein